MADDQELNLEELGIDDPNAVKQLRDYAKRQEARAKEAESLRREVAFLKAGIDLSSRKAQAWAQTFPGKLDDIEAIRADAREFDASIVVGPEAGQPQQSSDAKPGEPQSPDGTPAAQDTGSTERQNLADAAQVTGGAEDPREASIKVAKDHLERGRPLEVAAGELVAMRARSIHEGKMQSLGPSGTRG